MKTFCLLKSKRVACLNRISVEIIRRSTLQYLRTRLAQKADLNIVRTKVKIALGRQLKIVPFKSGNVSEHQAVSSYQKMLKWMLPRDSVALMLSRCS